MEVGWEKNDGMVDAVELPSDDAPAAPEELDELRAKEDAMPDICVSCAPPGVPKFDKPVEPPNKLPCWPCCEYC